jgi:hypothetical protein
MARRPGPAANWQPQPLTGSKHTTAAGERGAYRGWGTIRM